MCRKAFTVDLVCQTTSILAYEFTTNWIGDGSFRFNNFKCFLLL